MRQLKPVNVEAVLTTHEAQLRSKAGTTDNELFNASAAYLELLEAARAAEDRLDMLALNGKAKRRDREAQQRLRAAIALCEGRQS